MRFEPGLDYEHALAKASDESGIYQDYWDIFHRRHEASTEVKRGILNSLGWHLGTLDTLEEDRRRAFQKRFGTALPTTLVISSRDRAIPVSLPTSLDGKLEFEILLEHHHERLSGAVEISSLG